MCLYRRIGSKNSNDSNELPLDFVKNMQIPCSYNGKQKQKQKNSKINKLKQ